MHDIQSTDLSISPSLTTDPSSSWSLRFPEVGRRPATILSSDLEFLADHRQLNNSIVNFAFRWFEVSLERDNPVQADMFYFFNTFLYKALTNSSQPAVLIDFERVRSWAGGVDIFSKDFVVIPIYLPNYWVFAVIINLD